MTTSWRAGYRDFVILDPANMRPIAAYNLTDNPLSNPDNRAELTGILLGLAQLKDEDGDKLSDYWEDQMHGERSGGQGDDLDGDRSDALIEYGLGSHSGDAGILPEVFPGTVSLGGESYHAVTFRRRLGAAGGLSYVVEFSRDGRSWSSSPADIIEFSQFNPYDGTGTEFTFFRTARPVGEEDRGLWRVRVLFPEDP